MPVEDPLSDDLVAQILKKDAADSSLRYSAIGLQALLPKRPTSAAPKPNTRFLRNVIRETDSHNAALQAKEAAESRARLKKLQGEPGSPKQERRRHHHHRRSHRAGEGEADMEYSRSKRRRDYDSEDEDRHRHRHHRHHRRSHSHRLEEESIDGEPRRPKWRRGGGSSNEDEPDSGKNHHHRRYHRSRRDDDYEVRDEKYKHRSRHYNDHLDGGQVRKHSRREYRDRSRSRSGSEERPRRTHDKDTNYRRARRKHSRTRTSSRDRAHDHRTRRRHHSSTSPSRSASPRPDRPIHRSPNQIRTTSPTPPSPTPGSESDPLDEIIGPAPPSAQSKIRSRGRGTFASASAMDAHFSNDYDPNTDVAPPSEDDDWEQALEAHRDRQKWKAQGAQRLREAGFSEVEVRKWEASGTGKERGEEDVVWGRKGEGREWDRGKVFDDVTGEVGLGGAALEWGRLKGT